jgi:transketolase
MNSVMEDPFAAASEKGGRRSHVASLELAAMAAERDDILLLAADLGKGPLGAAFIAHHPDRFYDFGIAEANSLSAAAGLAACGLKPYVIEMSCFSALKCAEQIRNDIAFPKLPVRILSSLPGLALAYFGTSHHAVEDIAIVRSITNMTMVAPSDPGSTRALMRLTADHPGPVYFRLMQGSEPTIYDEPITLEFGRFPTLRDGDDLAIVGTGLGTQAALAAAEELAKEGISATVLDALFLKPLDEEAIIAAARRCGRVLTVEEHNVVGGLGTAVAEIIARNRIPAGLSIHGLPDEDLEVATPPELYRHYGLTAEGVAAKARELVSA